jgi:uncharacterized coiled-coil protein SlyX
MTTREPTMNIRCDYWPGQFIFNMLIALAVVILLIATHFQRDTISRSYQQIKNLQEDRDHHQSRINILLARTDGILAHQEAKLQPPAWDHDRPPSSSPELRIAWNQKKIDELRQSIIKQRKDFELLLTDQESMTALKQRLEDNIRQPLPDPAAPKPPPTIEPDSIKIETTVVPDNRPLINPDPQQRLLEILDPSPLDSPNDEPTKNKVPSPPPR